MAVIGNMAEFQLQDACVGKIATALFIKIKITKCIVWYAKHLTGNHHRIKMFVCTWMKIHETTGQKILHGEPKRKT